VTQGNVLPGFTVKSGLTALCMVVLTLSGWAQQAAPPSTPESESLAAAVRDLQQQVRELREAVSEVRTEAAQYRAETAELRRELAASRAIAASPSSESASSEPSATAPAQENTGTATALESRVAALEDSTQLLGSKVDEQYQSKVSSASKYRVRLSGIALMNLFSNRGVTDTQDVPTWADPRTAIDSKGDFGATLRQSEIGLEVFGPHLAGAKTSGNVQFDFSGGFPNTPNGVDFGLVRLRIATMRLDWERTSLIAGQDNVFVSPLTPTSFASLAVPALTYAGNLWGWIPQVRVEHRFDMSTDQSVTVQGGIFDNLTGETPADSFVRYPHAGERTGQPAYGTRVTWTHTIFGQPLTIGAAGYYSRQDWAFNRHVNGWAGMSDWQIPLAPRVELSGEFYRGQAIGALGSAFAQSVRLNGDYMLPNTRVLGLDSVGGWSQLKIKASSKLEFNGAWGIDSPFAGEVRNFVGVQNYVLTSLQRNRSGLVNFIYRPRSDLLFSAEYRHFRTFYSDNTNPQAQQVNLIMGFLF